MEKPYNLERIENAVHQFEQQHLEPIEGLLASNRLMISEFRRFRESAGDFRVKVGDQVAKDFAHQELNDVICELQDLIAPAIRMYNSLLRDLDQSGEVDGGPAT